MKSYRRLTAEELADIKIGDVVTRSFCDMQQQWHVSVVDDELITIGMGWHFCRKTGVEVDEDLQWGPKWGRTGSFLCIEQALHS